jgi:hypothetical protein
MNTMNNIFYKICLITTICTFNLSCASDISLERSDYYDPFTMETCLDAKCNVGVGGFAGMLMGTVAGGIAVPLTNVALAPLYGAATGTVVVPLVLYAIGGIRYCCAKKYQSTCGCG